MAYLLKISKKYYVCFLKNILKLLNWRANSEKRFESAQKFTSKRNLIFWELLRKTGNDWTLPLKWFDESINKKKTSCPFVYKGFRATNPSQSPENQSQQGLRMVFIVPAEFSPWIAVSWSRKKNMPISVIHKPVMVCIVQKWKRKSYSKISY